MTEQKIAITAGGTRPGQNTGTVAGRGLRQAAGRPGVRYDIVGTPRRHTGADRSCLAVGHRRLRAADPWDQQTHGAVARQPTRYARRGGASWSLPARWVPVHRLTRRKHLAH